MIPCIHFIPVRISTARVPECSCHGSSEISLRSICEDGNGINLQITSDLIIAWQNTKTDCVALQPNTFSLTCMQAQITERAKVGGVSGWSDSPRSRSSMASIQHSTFGRLDKTLDYIELKVYINSPEKISKFGPPKAGARAPLVCQLMCFLMGGIHSIFVMKHAPSRTGLQHYHGHSCTITSLATFAMLDTVSYCQS